MKKNLKSQLVTYIKYLNKEVQVFKIYNIECEYFLKEEFKTYEQAKKVCKILSRAMKDVGELPDRYAIYEEVEQC